jgi:hypothetical protein
LGLIFFVIFRGPIGAAKFLTHMLSLILRRAVLQNMLSIRIRNQVHVQCLMTTSPFTLLLGSFLHV